MVVEYFCDIKINKRQLVFPHSYDGLFFIVKYMLLMYVACYFFLFIRNEIFYKEESNIYLKVKCTSIFSSYEV